MDCVKWLSRVSEHQPKMRGNVWHPFATAFKLDVEDRLASIPPANADALTGDDDRLFRRLYL
jgi:hypothetical protein